MTKAMYGLLEPVFKENYAGRAEVINVFKITKVGQIAGCRVTDGLIKRDSQVRVLREGEEVWRGKIGSLKRFKDDVSEVRRAWSAVSICGLQGHPGGDVIEAFTTEKLADELGQNSAERKKADGRVKEAKHRENEIAAPAPQRRRANSTEQTKGRDHSRPLPFFSAVLEPPSRRKPGD